MQTEEIVLKRDELQQQLIQLYNEVPRTSHKAYTEAKKAMGRKENYEAEETNQPAKNLLFWKAGGKETLIALKSL